MEPKHESLTELKCRDCANYVLSGWWDPERVCIVSGFPVDKNGAACISVIPKHIKHDGKKSD